MSEKIIKTFDNPPLYSHRVVRFQEILEDWVLFERPALHVACEPPESSCGSCFVNVELGSLRNWRVLPCGAILDFQWVMKKLHLSPGEIDVVMNGERWSLGDGAIQNSSKICVVSDCFVKLRVRGYGGSKDREEMNITNVNVDEPDDEEEDSEHLFLTQAVKSGSFSFSSPFFMKVSVDVSSRFDSGPELIRNRFISENGHIYMFQQDFSTVLDWFNRSRCADPECTVDSMYSELKLLWEDVHVKKTFKPTVLTPSGEQGSSCSVQRCPTPTPSFSSSEEEPRIVIPQRETVVELPTGVKGIDRSKMDEFKRYTIKDSAKPESFEVARTTNWWTKIATFIEDHHILRYASAAVAGVRFYGILNTNQSPLEKAKEIGKVFVEHAVAGAVCENTTSIEVTSAFVGAAASDCMLRMAHGGVLKNFNYAPLLAFGAARLVNYGFTKDQFAPGTSYTIENEKFISSTTFTTVSGSSGAKEFKSVCKKADILIEECDAKEYKVTRDRIHYSPELVSAVTEKLAGNYASFDLCQSLICARLSWYQYNEKDIPLLVFGSSLYAYAISRAYASKARGFS